MEEHLQHIYMPQWRALQDSGFMFSGLIEVRVSWSKHLVIKRLLLGTGNELGSTNAIFTSSTSFAPHDVEKFLGAGRVSRGAYSAHPAHLLDSSNLKTEKRETLVR